MSISPSDSKGSSSSSSAQSFSGSPSSINGIREICGVLDSVRMSSSGEIQGYGYESGDFDVSQKDQVGANVSDDSGAPSIIFSSISPEHEPAELHMINPTTRKQVSERNSHGLEHVSLEHGGMSPQDRHSQLPGKLRGNLNGFRSANLNNSTPVASKRGHMSGNHLLNFHYDPITRPLPKARLPKRPQKIKPYDKDLFLQANYTFVLFDDGDNDIKSMDPDQKLMWEDVICVKFCSTSSVCCPICLDELLCPQITTCGHIFCLPCILQHLMTGVEDYKIDCCKKCPLCFSRISSGDLYTVFIDNVQQCCIGYMVNFTLLTRSKDSLVPYQKYDQEVRDGHKSSNGSFSKYLLTSHVELSFRESQLALNEWLSKVNTGEVDNLEQLPYVCAGIELLDQREKSWSEFLALSSNSPHAAIVQSLNSQTCKYASKKKLVHAVDSSQNDSGLCKTHSAADNCHNEYISGGENIGSLKEELWRDSIYQEMETSSETTENFFLLDEEVKGFRGNVDEKNGSQERDSYTFYQLEDGQLVILHPLNMKCLLHHYGDYELLPSRISGKILQLESITQTEVTRKRYRYLSHFSLTTTFQLCEIDLSAMLPPESLSPFMDEIRKREHQRKRRTKQEDEERDRAMAVEISSTINNIAVSRVPEKLPFSEDDFKALGSSLASSTSPPTFGERKLFSDVTRLGYAAGHDSPTPKPEEPVEVTSAIHVPREVAEQNGPSRTTLSFASVMSSAAKPTADEETLKASSVAKKGKKSSRVLLSTAGGRRY